MTRMLPRRDALAVMALCSGCAEPAIDMHLGMPTGEAAQFDTSCVNQVSVTTWDSDFTTDDQCVPITGAATLADVAAQIRGKFALDLPDEMIGLQLHAYATDTPETCITGELMFYGGTDYDGERDVTIPVEGLVDCGVRQASLANLRTIKLIDFRTFVETAAGAAPSCAPPTEITEIEAGMLHATNMSPPAFTPTATDTWDIANVVDGKATLPVWSSSLGLTCPTLAYWESADTEDVASCVPAIGGPAICAAAGEVEVPVIHAATALSSLDEAIVEQNHGGVLVAVWDAALKKPITSATITIGDGEGQIVYGDWDATQARLVPSTAAATGAQGLALVYSEEPVQVTISAPGFHPSTRVLGAPWGVGAAAIVALLPQ
jgi:hypothetical protein